MEPKEKKILKEQEKDPLLDEPIEKSGPDKSNETIKQKGQENRESTEVVPDNKSEVLQNKKAQPVASDQDKEKIHQKGISTDKLQGTEEADKFSSEMTKKMREVGEKAKKFQKSFDTIFSFMGIDNPNIKTAPFNAKAVDDSKEIITDMKQSEYEDKKSLKEQYNMCDADWDKMNESENIIEQEDEYVPDYDPLLDEDFNDDFNDEGNNDIPELSDNSTNKLNVIPESDDPNYIPRYSDEEIDQFYNHEFVDDLQVDPNNMSREQLEDLMDEINGEDDESSDYEYNKINNNEENTLETYTVTTPVTEQIGYKIFLSTVDQIKNKKITLESSIDKFKKQQKANKKINTEQSKVFTRIYRGLENLNTKKK